MSEQLAGLDGGRFLADLFTKDALQASFQQKIINAINYLGKTLGANPVGNIAAPPRLDNLSVKTSGEMVHVSIAHNARVSKNAHYFLEVANEPNFVQPIVKHIGVSRTPEPFPLPTFDDNGNMQTWYFRAYSQYPGSKPSPTLTFGGASPVGIQMSGTTNLSLLPSTGSGTASTTGKQGGQGFGKSNVQPVIAGQQQAAVPPTVAV